jgi:hypothetical protein
MVELRYQQQNAPARLRIAHRPLHVARRSDRRETLRQRIDGAARPARRIGDAHEEQFGFDIIELL